MAGKTLTGIGDDESGKHELALDKSDSAIQTGKPPSQTATAKPFFETGKPPSETGKSFPTISSARSTDRMPMFAGPAGGPAVDDDKVAEGLKKLRSLDEPLGPIPSSTPTLKESIPAVGSGAPTPANPAAVVAAAAAELIRSRGTAHGHALSAAAGAQRIMPVSVDDRMKGTLLGHSLHLPDLPELSEAGEENRPAEIRLIARVAPTGALTPGEMNTDFSHGDSRFFENQPINHEYEAENPRGKLMMRVAMFVAVVSVIVVAAFAYVRVRKPDSPPPPAEARATTSAPDNPAAAAPTAPAPTELPPPAAAVPAPATPPSVAVAPQEEANPRVLEAAPKAESMHGKTHHHVVAAAPTPNPAVAKPPVSKPPSPHAARPGEPAREIKPTVPGRRGKTDEDPDGTLPLTE
jgi:hypothetical protein